jgi:hypothetical protein
MIIGLACLIIKSIKWWNKYNGVFPCLIIFDWLMPWMWWVRTWESSIHWLIIQFTPLPRHVKILKKQLIHSVLRQLSTSGHHRSPSRERKDTNLFSQGKMGPFQVKPERPQLWGLIEWLEEHWQILFFHFEYSSPPLSARDVFQDPQQMPETSDINNCRLPIHTYLWWSLI